MSRERALVVVALVLACGLMPAVGSPCLALELPSRVEEGQSVAQREADLASIMAVMEQEEVVATLADHGLSTEQIHHRLASLSPQEIHSFATHLDQIQAAGANVPQYIWILLAVFLGVLILAALF